MDQSFVVKFTQVQTHIL